MKKSLNNVIALFMPSKTSFYQGLFNSMKKAFVQHNYKVIGGYGFLEDKELNSFIDKNKPKVFFEMNRCKNEINNFPKNILHICWLVDLLGRKLEDIQGSDIIYFISTEWMKDFKLSKIKVDWLPPASDPEEYYPIKNIQKIFKSIFLGHIPNPWKNELLQRVIHEDKHQKILFSDVLEKFENKWASQDKIINNDRYLQEVKEWLENKTLHNIEIEDRVLRYDISCRTIRKARRLYFLDWLLINCDLTPFAIFGSTNWINYPQYKNMYQKELHTTKEMNLIFNQSKSVIHEGVGFHFRVFDAMLAGTPIIIRKSQQDTKFGGIGTIFKENVDYISIDISLDESKRLKLNDEKLKRISINAREKVLLNHTWFHRLSKVVRDIDEVYK